ncbi:bacterio-opsin activator domain-containing protein [Halomarina halobia]|uniref:Bacterio-opsin activator domain-containing protein n=1 Tax=Halomarina halobia TaxID=3033386 RepID=A0ABD6A802_9EURY|nr:bacterio-opsin activator domain-containing protein [Halomarina sp. PSR21]
MAEDVEFRGIVEQAGHAVVVLDADGTIEYANRAFERLTGYRASEVVGRPYRFVVSEHAAGYAEEARRTALAGETWRGEVPVERASGDSCVVHQSVAPTTTDGAVTGLVVVAAERAEPTSKERVLEERFERLERVKRIIDAVRPVTGILLDASTREEVYEPVCDRLVETDAYDVAWLGDYHPASDEVALRALSGVEAGDLGSFTADPTDADGPVARAVRTREAQVVTDLAGHLSATSLPADRFRDLAAGIVVPLFHGETVYGLLGVYTARTSAFEEYERLVLAEIGAIVGYAYRAIENRQLLLSDTVVEVEFRSTDTRLHAVAVNAEHGGRFELRSLVPAPDDTLLAYVEVRDVDPRIVLDSMAETSDVRECRVVSEDVADQAALVQCRLVAGFLSLPIAEYGANVRSLVVEDGVMDLVCEVSPHTDVRAFVEHVTTASPETEVVRKRERTGAVTDDRPPEARQLAEQLTERQRDALEAAYRAGYFEWSRESTAEEVAAAMGITAPTFHKHLRKGLDAVMTALFEADEPS